MTAAQRRAYTRQKKSAAEDRDAENARRREKRRQLRLLLSAFVLLLAVLIKLLAPAFMRSVQAKLAPALDANVDVQEVFSAVGRAVSGGGDAAESWREAARAVFSPASVEGGTAAETAAAETGRAETLRAVYSTAKLPQNVCLTQRVLGFAYTSPLQGTLTSAFGGRESPLADSEEFHYGVDLAAAEGTKIASFADGTVRAAAESSSLGSYLLIDHANGYTTLYAHCSRLCVSAGENVRRGQTVAEAGHTGDATGPHLHFELRCGSIYLNPIYYVKVM